MLEPKFDHDLSGPEWAFRKLMHAHHTAHGAVFDRLGLKEVGQPMLLFILADTKRSGQRCTQKELAEFLERSPSTITISINSLEKRGYIHRYVDENDKRRNYVEITDQGMVMAQRCREAFDHIDEAMFDGFTDGQKALLAELFNHISANLMTLAGGESEECQTC